MGCNSCIFLDELNKKEGKLNGTVYYCTKYKKYVNGAKDGCDNYSKDYSRKSYDANEIYAEGKKYSDDTTPIGIYLIALGLLVFVSLVAKIFFM